MFSLSLSLDFFKLSGRASISCGRAWPAAGALGPQTPTSPWRERESELGEVCYGKCSSEFKLQYVSCKTCENINVI